MKFVSYMPVFRGFVMFDDILIKFDSDGNGICPVCSGIVSNSHCQLIKHYQCLHEVEVCINCKNDFIKINDIFFRGIL